MRRRSSPARLIEANRCSSVNNNAWNKDDSGGICTFVGAPYPIVDSLAHIASQVCDTCSDISFYSLWNWTSQPVTVHAYPNVELKSSNLPLQLRNLASLYISATWDFAPASLPAGTSQDPNTEPDASEITSNNVQANVVLDVFADPDREKSQTPSKQKYELMVWVGVFGDASWVSLLVTTQTCMIRHDTAKNSSDPDDFVADWQKCSERSTGDRQAQQYRLVSRSKVVSCITMSSH